MPVKRFLVFGVILSATAIGLYAHETIYYRDAVEFLAPIDIKGNIPIRNDMLGKGGFGASRSGDRTHEGLDILAKVGEPVRAAKSGRVVVGDVPDGMGKYVNIAHPGALMTRYGHLSKISVERGRKVRQGDIIGEVGKTGNANYPSIKSHLHFEVRESGEPVDPLKYLK